MSKAAASRIHQYLLFIQSFVSLCFTMRDLGEIGYFCRKVFSTSGSGNFPSAFNTMGLFRNGCGPGVGFVVVSSSLGYSHPPVSHQE